MSDANFAEVMSMLLSIEPFQLVIVGLTNGTRYEIDSPDSLSLVGSIATFKTIGGIRVVFDHDSVQSIYLASAARLNALEADSHRENG